MNRRGFMGLLGAVGLTGPQAAAKVTAESLNLKGVGLLSHLVDGTDTSSSSYYGPIAQDNSHRIEWATKKLAKMAMQSFTDNKRQMHEWEIHRLDADTYALRSMSLVNKMRRSQRFQYNLEQEREKVRLNRIIMGLED